MKTKKPLPKKIGGVEIRQEPVLGGVVLENDTGAKIFVPADMLLAFAYRIVTWGVWFKEQNETP